MTWSRSPPPPTNYHQLSTLARASLVHEFRLHERPHRKMKGCLHIPSFPAWAFQRYEQIDLPLVVISGGCVVAATQGLRRIGVACGITAERVQALVPEVVIRMRDASFEKAAWEEVLQVVNGYTPFLESREIGFAFFHPPDHVRDTRALAASLQAQMGMGPYRSIALLASLKPAAGTMLRIDPEHVSSFLTQFPVEKLAELHFEEPFIEQLGLFGYQTLGQARSLSLRHLEAQFGEDGKRLHELLHPLESEGPIPIYSPSPSITSLYEFEEPASEPADLLPALEFLMERASARLADQRCQRIKVSFQGPLPADNRFACQVLPEPVHSPGRLMHTARKLIKQLLSSPVSVETLVLELSALRRPQAEQSSLFAHRPGLYRAVEAVHRRFPGAIKRAVLYPGAVFPEERVQYERR